MTSRAIEWKDGFAVGLAERCDVPNINGIIYPKEVLESFIEPLKTTNYLITGPYTPPSLACSGVGFSLENIAGETNDAWVDNEGLWLKVKPLSTRDGKILFNLSQFARKVIGFSISIRGALKDGIVQSNSKLEFISFERLDFLE